MTLQKHTLTIVILLGLVVGAKTVSALTYSSDVGVEFTFEPTISVSVSSDLIINDLTPGTTADSNIVDLNVATNNPYGYTLLATAGTSSTNTNLVNTTNSNYKFTNISTASNVASLTTDNSWGFNYSTNNGSTWSNYTGLPKDNDDEGATGKQLAKTDSPTNSPKIKMKIGAKASASQSSGTYTNVVNFYAVANPLTERHYTIDYHHTIEEEYVEILDMPSQQTGVLENNQITISSLQPYDPDGGYSIYGWCDEESYGQDCPGNVYYPGDTINIDEGTEDVFIVLYLIWDAGGGLPSFSVNNESDGTVSIYSNYDAYPITTVYPYGFESLVGYDSLSIDITPPQMCESRWYWEATYYDWDLEETVTESGTGGGGMSFDNLSWDINVVITGYCDDSTGPGT